MHQLSSLETYLISPLAARGYAIHVRGLIYRCALNVRIEAFLSRNAKVSSYAVEEAPRSTNLTQRTALRLALTGAASDASSLFVVTRLDITYGRPIEPLPSWVDDDTVVVPWLPAAPRSGNAPDQIYVISRSAVATVAEIMATYDSNSSVCEETAPSLSPEGITTFHGTCDCTQRLFVGPLIERGLRILELWDSPNGRAGSCDKRRGVPAPFTDCARCEAPYCLPNSTATCRTYTGGAPSRRTRCPKGRAR